MKDRGFVVRRIQQIGVERELLQPRSVWLLSRRIAPAQKSARNCLAGSSSMKQQAEEQGASALLEPSENFKVTALLYHQEPPSLHLPRRKIFDRVKV